jgi:large subunit ribosomal protein L48
MSILNRVLRLKHLNKSQSNSYFSSALKSTNLHRNNEKQQEKLIDLINNSNKSQDESKVELKFYDPPYLNKKPSCPTYEQVNVNLKSYDASSLDTYFQFIQKLCQFLKVNTDEAYCMPARNFKIKIYQPFSSNLDKEYKLNMYHRVVRINNIKSTLAPFLFETIHLNLPEGVQLSVSVVNKDEDEFRYVPDIELNELKEKLEEMSKKPKTEEILAKSVKK